MGETIVGMGEVAIGFEGDTLTALGLGSCISVILYDLEQKIAGVAHVMLPSMENSRFHLPPRTVMLAENDSQIRNTIKSILLSNNFEVIGEAEERTQTLQLYREKRPGLSFISVYLPPTNALETLRGIRSIDTQARLILLSPSRDEALLAECQKAGLHDVVYNPFTAQQVASSAELVLNRRLLRFADKAIPLLRDRLIALGAQRLVAKIAGGAHMFKTFTDPKSLIGTKNAESVKKILANENITIVAEDIGSNLGRTVRFDVSNGAMMINTKDGVKTL